MGWHITGVEAIIGIGDGAPFIRGDGRQFPRLPTEASAEATPLIRDAVALWSFHSNADKRSVIDPSGFGFRRRIDEQPDLSHFMISYFEASNGQPQAIGFTISLPRHEFDFQLSLWREFVFRASPVTYSINLDYIGFRSPEAKTDNPTVTEWMAHSISSQKAIFGSGVRTSFHSQFGATPDGSESEAPKEKRRLWLNRAK